jgi:hypothetical protein
MAYDDTDTVQDQDQDKDQLADAMPPPRSRPDMPVPPPPPEPKPDPLSLSQSPALDPQLPTGQPLGTGPLGPQPKTERDKAAAAEMKKRFDEHQDRKDRMLQEQGRRAEEPLPEAPQQKHVSQPPPQDLGAHANEWLMAASVLAGFAGLASRRSSINALSAFSGALDGLAKGDKERFDANYQTWKAESDTTIKNNQIEMDKYETLLKRRDLDQRQISTMVEIEATRQRNEFIRQVAEKAAADGDISTLTVAYDSVQGQMAQYEIAKQRMNQMYEERMAIERFRKSGTMGGQFDQATSARIDSEAEDIRAGRRQPYSSFVTSKNEYAREVMSRAFGAGYDQREWQAGQRALTNFDAGVESRKITALNTAVNHLASLEKLIDAMNNTNVRRINETRNTFGRETGRTAPTDFAGIKDFVMDEVVGAIVAGAGAAGDRERAQEVLNRDLSGPQLKGVVNRIRELMAGRLAPMQQTYERATGRTDWDRFLTPETKKALQPGSAATPPPGFKGRIATNPKTGEKMREVAPKHWEPVPGPRSEVESNSNPMFAAIGARQAQDGEWYVNDPDRPGKYMQVVMGDSDEDA